MTIAKHTGIIKKSLPGDQFLFVQIENIVLKIELHSWMLFTIVKIVASGVCGLNGWCGIGSLQFGYDSWSCSQEGCDKETNSLSSTVHYKPPNWLQLIASFPLSGSNLSTPPPFACSVHSDENVLPTLESA